MVHCAARLSATVMVGYLACVKTDVEAHEMIQYCGLAYSIDRESLIGQLLSVLQQTLAQNIVIKCSIQVK